VKYSGALIALVGLAEVAAAQTVPTPRPRPLVEVTQPPTPSACRLRMAAERIIASSVANIEGPGDCGGSDLVRLQAVPLPGHGNVELSPPAVLRCEMAEAVAVWLKEDVAELAALTFGSRLRSVRTYTAYQCRPRNNLVGGVTSEHGKGNALDVGSITLIDGKTIDPTDVKISPKFREAWKRSVCDRFATVLGPGADAYHEKHIHLDIKDRRNGYRMCQWEIREADQSQPPTFTESVPLPQPRPRAGLSGRLRKHDR
jgi:hypothetical protein